MDDILVRKREYRRLGWACEAQQVEFNNAGATVYATIKKRQVTARALPFLPKGITVRIRKSKGYQQAVFPGSPGGFFPKPAIPYLQTPFEWQLVGYALYLPSFEDNLRYDNRLGHIALPL